jgi:hypothetical protein
MSQISTFSEYSEVSNSFYNTTIENDTNGIDSTEIGIKNTILIQKTEKENWISSNSNSYTTSQSNESFDTCLSPQTVIVKILNQNGVTVQINHQNCSICENFLKHIGNETCQSFCYSNKMQKSDSVIFLKEVNNTNQHE